MPLPNFQGPPASFLKQLSEMPPESVQFDVLRFEASVSAAGAVTDAAAVEVPSGYDFICFAYSGYIESPGDAVANFVLLTWNMKRDGKRNVFTTDQSFADLLTIDGPLPPKTFVPWALYLFPEKAKITVTVSRSGTWNGGAKKAAINLYGVLVPSPGKK